MSDARSPSLPTGRSRAFLALAMVAALLVPFGAVSAKPAPPPPPPAPKHEKAIFFVSDGLRQDAVAAYASQGLMPTMKKFLKDGAYASGNGLLTQAPPNTGAGWYALATGAWPGVPGSTNNTFHSQGPAVRKPTSAFDPACSRPRRSRSRPSAAARRSPRSSGPAGGTRRSRARRSTSRRSSPAAAWPRTSSATGRAIFDNDAFVTASDSSSTPGGLRGPGPVPGAAPARRPDGPNVRGSFSPAHGDAPARARLRRRQVRAQRLHLRQHERQHDELRQGPVRAGQRTAPTGSAPCAGRVGRRQGEDRRRRRSMARRPACSSRSRR